MQYSGVKMVVGLVAIVLCIAVLASAAIAVSWWKTKSGGDASNRADFISHVNYEDAEKVPPLAAEEADIVLNFNNIAAKAVEISTFEDQPGSGWYGQGVYDTGNAYEGHQSLQLISLDGQAASSTLTTPVDFAAINILDMAVQADNPLAYDTLAIDIGDKDFTKFYRYKFTNLNQGWNLVQINTDQFIAEGAAGNKNAISWADADNIRLLLISRPNSIATVRFDMLQGLVQNEDLLNRLRIPRGSEYRSTLYSQYGKNRLAVRNTAQSTVVQFAEPKTARDFILAATLWPQTEADSGLYFRGNYINGDGYYFTISGDLGKGWQLQKKNGEGLNTILQGELTNENFIKYEPYGVMIEAKGDTIKLYLNKSGEEQFALLGEITDDEFANGGVGVVVTDQGWSVFDDIRYKAL